MPAIETSDCHQKAVLWAATGVDGYGNPIVSAAVEIDVRWEEERRESIDAFGNPIALDASVVVDREIAIDSILWLGELIDLPDPPTDLKKVVSRSAVPDVKGRSFRRKVSLVNFSDELPTIA